MVSLAATQAASYSLFLDIQKLYRFVNHNDEFKLAFNSATEEQRKLFEHYITIGKRTEVLDLVKFILKENNKLETYSMKELRKLAHSYCIENWSFLSKDILIKKIKERQNDHRYNFIARPNEKANA